MNAKPASKRSSAAETASIHAMPAHLIRRCHQIAVSLFHEECADELTPIQFAVLALLDQHEGVDQITLAGLAALNRSTAGEVVGRLETAGLVTRTDNAADRRVKLVAITDIGRKLLRQVEQRVRRVQERLLAPLDAKERKTFVTLLARIASENNELSRAPLRRPGGA